MLKTNSKAVTAAVRNWILDNAATEGYDGMPKPKGTDGNWDISQFDELAVWILKTVESEKFYSRGSSPFATFRDWAQGLPHMLNTADYYYTHSAVDVLGDILQESPSEKAAYTESDAERLMDLLVFRELRKGERKVKK